MRRRVIDVEHVLMALSRGKSQKAIAIEANVSQSCVSHTLGAWARASGAKTVTQAIIDWAIKKGQP